MNLYELGPTQKRPSAFVWKERRNLRIWSFRPAPQAGSEMEQVSSDVVPETGVEPARSFGTQDFKSRASTNSATPAWTKPSTGAYILYHRLCRVSRINSARRPRYFGTGPAEVRRKTGVRRTLAAPGVFFVVYFSPERSEPKYLMDSSDRTPSSRSSSNAWSMASRREAVSSPFRRGMAMESAFSE